VFLDVDTISAGEDFREVIYRTCSSCKVMLAIIGKEWATVIDRHSKVRLQNENDYVRMEISTALQKGLRVIPVLVGGAAMPGEEALPEDLRPLLYRNAWDVSDQRFHRDVELLVESLKKTFDAVPQEPTASIPAKPALFPIYGIILGKTTASEIAKLGERFHDTNLYSVRGTNFFLNKESGRVDTILMSGGNCVPELWEKIGFRWQNSEDGWISWFREMGYTVKVERRNAITRFLKETKNSTTIRGLMSWPNPHDIEVNFRLNSYSIETIHDIWIRSAN
jgi:hypothetical protein